MMKTEDRKPITALSKPVMASSAGSGGGDSGDIHGLLVRVAKLESDVHHMMIDMADVKVDIRQLDHKFEQKFDRLENRFDKLGDRIDKLGDRIDTHLKWMLSLYGMGFLVLSGVMAHGFRWF